MIAAEFHRKPDGVLVDQELLEQFPSLSNRLDLTYLILKQIERYGLRQPNTQLSATFSEDFGRVYGKWVTHGYLTKQDVEALHIKGAHTAETFVELADHWITRKQLGLNDDADPELADAVEFFIELFKQQGPQELRRIYDQIVQPMFGLTETELFAPVADYFYDTPRTRAAFLAAYHRLKPSGGGAPEPLGGGSDGAPGTPSDGPLIMRGALATSVEVRVRAQVRSGTDN